MRKIPEGKEPPRARGEAQAKWDKMREQVEKNLVEVPQDQIDAVEAMNKAMYDLANDMTYPMDPEGNQMNIHFVIPMLSYHLARCGYQKVEGAATIKQIPHPRRGQPGVVEDAVIYVPVDAAGEIPEMYLQPPEDQPAAPVNQPWKTRTHITLNGETIKGEPNANAAR